MQAAKTDAGDEGGDTHLGWTTSRIAHAENQRAGADDQHDERDVCEWDHFTEDTLVRHRTGD